MCLRGLLCYFGCLMQQNVHELGEIHRKINEIVDDVNNDILNKT